jgi:hypothetical protein
VLGQVSLMVQEEGERSAAHSAQRQQPFCTPSSLIFSERRTSILLMSPYFLAEKLFSLFLPYVFSGFEACTA